MKSMSTIKEEIQTYEFEFSGVNMLYLNTATATVSAVIIGIVALIGIVIKGFFVYYVRYKAPKDRPINRMIFFDQVIITVYSTTAMGSLIGTLIVL